MPKLFVGIDVSKDSSRAKGLDQEGDSKFYLEFKMDSEGFSELLKALTAPGEDLSQVTVAKESIVITMHYLLTGRMIVLLYGGL
jgi:transposase